MIIKVDTAACVVGSVATQADMTQQPMKLMDKPGSSGACRDLSSLTVMASAMVS
ncbi:MAG: hypothetical protein ACK4E3_01320 [Brevundimonas sp.]|uniref:hypothetical protein n=1 Tax=Brevundimonas sp. TaxID=1871086 RepID=UPI00391B258E